MPGTCLAAGPVVTNKIPHGADTVGGMEMRKTDRHSNCQIMSNPRKC